MCNKVKKFGLSIKAGSSNSNNWRFTTYIVTVVTLIVAIVALIYAADQVRVGRSELEQAGAQFGARTRPYLSIESIRVENRGEDWIAIMIGINNLGEMPPSGVQLERISMGGEEIVWISQADEDYPAITNATGEGITITTGGIVIVPGYSEFPEDMLFFPRKLNTIEVPARGTTWRTIITDGSVMDIGLVYFCGDVQYEYVATAMLSGGEWGVTLERGN